MLDSIPPELLRMIISQVSDGRDLQSLCRVSKAVNEATIPLLYETFVLSAQEDSLLCAGRDRFDEGSTVHLRHTKCFRIYAPFREKLERRCPHDEVEEKMNIREWRDTERTGDLGKFLLSIMKALPDDQLRGFSWHLGTCVPIMLLGPGSDLTERQTHIEALSLITDHECGYNFSGRHVMDLSKFKYLRVFSWIGLRSKRDFSALRECLEGNALQLESLTIGLIDFQEPIRASEIFKLDEGAVERSYPSLDRLSLSGISFRSAINDVPYGLNFENLRKLKIYNCRDAIPLLLHVAQSNSNLKLTSFEFGMTEYLWSYRDIEDLPSLKTFLEAFEGLRDLYILVLGDENWRPLVQAALNHGKTLQRFVLHNRLFDNDDESDRIGELRDLSLDWYPELENLFLLPKLECIGVCIEIHLLHKQILGLRKKPLCKILHIRSGSSEIKEGSWINVDEVLFSLFHFAQWAFGPDGLPDLQLLAFGDFSYKGRYAKHNVLLCRKGLFTQNMADASSDLSSSTLTFHKLSKNNKEVKGLGKFYSDFLEACPVEDLVKVFDE